VPSLSSEVDRSAQGAIALDGRDAGIRIHVVLEISGDGAIHATAVVVAMITSCGGWNGVGEDACTDDGERDGETPGDGHGSPQSRFYGQRDDGCGAVMCCRPGQGRLAAPGRRPRGRPRVNPAPPGCSRTRSDVPRTEKTLGGYPGTNGVWNG
jgi:hypothetical protein